ncbi:myotubularin-related protein 14 [Prorops nasuta]|uniref:myotubularin-related protein 14 n=1 Tax=Prorops nasuta TaxID=863751 RepID=UPI0034CE114B
MIDIQLDDLQKLLTYFSKNTYRVKDSDTLAQEIMQQCLLIADIDYTFTVINNSGGDLSAQYPSHLIILNYEKSNENLLPLSLSRASETIYETAFEPNKLKETIKQARFARCRSRFPLPVILYKGRHICRSSTLSGGPEIYGRSGLDYLFPSDDGPVNVQPPTRDPKVGESTSMEDWALFDKVRYQDIKLLQTLNVGTIIDFMVEKKKVKFGVNVTSSEKVDKEKRYAEFTIISLPYPGCEFFREFRDNNYIAKGLIFDWTQAHVDAEIGVPEDSVSSQLKMNWEDYQVWDLVKLTQNYLKLILKYLTESSSSMLIHCISGWDRTPLFISLLRISLWADGVVHQSLSAFQLLYFTIAYDWFLFGHDLGDRISKGEEIFFFCFDFLKNILDEEFSVHTRQGRCRHNILRNDSEPQLDNAICDNESVVSLSSNLSWSSNHSQNSRDSQDNNPPAVFHCSPHESSDESQSNGNVLAWTFFNSLNKEGVSPPPPVPAPSSTASSQGSRSPLPPNRTSPVAVPVPCRYRTRNESTSSCGSWQMISGTGSLRGSTTANAPVSDAAFAGLSCKPSCETCTSLISQDSNITIIEDEASSPLQTRRDRLHCLRRVFFHAYSPTVGFRLKDNSETSGIGQLLGTFAEKVGIYSTQRTTL